MFTSHCFVYNNIACCATHHYFFYFNGEVSSIFLSFSCSLSLSLSLSLYIFSLFIRVLLLSLLAYSDRFFLYRCQSITHRLCFFCHYPTSQCAIIDNSGEALFPFFSLARYSDISMSLFKEKWQLKRDQCSNSLPKWLHLMYTIITYICMLLSNQWKKEKNI